MKKSGQSPPREQIDMRQIIFNIWKEKITILATTLLITIIGFALVYEKNPKKFTSTITVRDAPNHFFEEYRPFLIKDFFQSNQGQPVGIAESFNNEFELNLLSIENLLVFFEENNKIEAFKDYLKKNNISARDYFNGGLKILIDTDKKSAGRKYYLSYTPPLNADDFLNNYIAYTKIKTEKIIIEQILERIQVEIKVHEQTLNIAKRLDIIKPYLFGEKNTGYIQDSQSYYRGTEVITQQIINLNDLLKRTKEFKLNYNPILIKASSSMSFHLNKKEAKNPIFNLMAFILLGLILSIIIIFFKSVIKNES